jgi:hypothetical protein
MKLSTCAGLRMFSILIAQRVIFLLYLAKMYIERMRKIEIASKQIGETLHYLTNTALQYSQT